MASLLPSPKWIMVILCFAGMLTAGIFGLIMLGMGGLGLIFGLAFMVWAFYFGLMLIRSVATPRSRYDTFLRRQLIIMGAFVIVFLLVYHWKYGDWPWS